MPDSATPEIRKRLFVDFGDAFTPNPAAGHYRPPSERERYLEAMVGFTQPFFITPCDGRKLR